MDEEYDIKKAFSSLTLVIVMCGLWSLVTVLFLVGIPLSIIDWLFGSELILSMENMLWTGSSEARFFKTWLWGIPITFIWLISKNWKL